MHRDTVIGIVGVVILVAAMVGVFTYERSQAGDLDGGGAGAGAANFTSPAFSETVAVGETAEQAFTLNQTGITNVTFTLTWTPGQNSLDTMSFAVVMPGNMTHDAPAEDDGEITLVVPVANADAAGTLGVGAWQIVVSFDSSRVTSPAGPPPVDPGLPGADQSVAFNVEIAGTAHASG